MCGRDVLSIKKVLSIKRKWGPQIAIYLNRSLFRCECLSKEIQIPTTIKWKFTPKYFYEIKFLRGLPPLSPCTVYIFGWSDVAVIFWFWRYPYKIHLFWMYQLFIFLMKFTFVSPTKNSWFWIYFSQFLSPYVLFNLPHHSFYSFSLYI